MKNVKRLEEFDVLKGIGILLVVLGHCNISDVLSRMIFSFHMPLFFMISGFFYYRQSPTRFLKKTAMRLLVPWLFFVALNIFYAVVYGFWLSHDIHSTVIETLAKINPLREYSHLLYRAIWFLIALFFVGNLYNFICHMLSAYHIDNPRVLDGIVLLSYMVGYLSQLYIDLPFFVDSALSVVLYYHLGSKFKSFLTDTDVGNFWRSPWVSVLIFVALMCLPAFFSIPEVDIKLNQYPWWLPFFMVPVFFALYNIVKWLCSKHVCLPLRKLLVKCGFYSLCFLGFHRIVMDAIYVVYDKLPEMSETVHIITYFVILIPLVLWLSQLLEKHAPVLIGSKRK